MKKNVRSWSVAAIRYEMKFLRRAKISREISMASIIVDNPSPVRTRSAAARAASVAPWTAIPTGKAIGRADLHAILLDESIGD